MARNMSFMLTTQQILAGTKDVTRRLASGVRKSTFSAIDHNMSKELQVAQQVPLSKERQQRIRKYVRSSKAGGTQRVYQSRWADFTEWCAWRGYVSMLPAPPAVEAYEAAQEAK